MEYYIAMNAVELKLYIKIWMSFKNETLNKKNPYTKECKSPFI